MQNGKSVTLWPDGHEHECDAFDEFMRAKVREALDDPRPNIPAKDVFTQLRKLHEERLSGRKSTITR